MRVREGQRRKERDSDIEGTRITCERNWNCEKRTVRMSIQINEIESVPPLMSHIIINRVQVFVFHWLFFSGDTRRS